MVWPVLDVTVISIRVPSSMTPSLEAALTNDSILGWLALNWFQAGFNQKEGLIPRSLLRNKLFQDMEEVIY